jgi:hemerythrin-like metal-binding protein
MTTFTLPWMQHLALAAAGMDDDHRALLDKLNALLVAISSGDKTRLTMAISTLRVAAEEHFATEERQMRDLEYPDLEPHCESHQRLLQNLCGLQINLYVTERFAATMGPFAFLERWFVAHLTNDDQRFADFLARPAPEVPAAAG